MTFEIIKSIVSDCICKTLRYVNVKITEKELNLLANEYADKILSQFKQGENNV